MADDQELYLQMDGFRNKPPPPIPRLNEGRRHSEVPWNASRQGDLGSVIAQFQESSISQSQHPRSASNYPIVNLRDGKIKLVKPIFD